MWSFKAFCDQSIFKFVSYFRFCAGALGSKTFSHVDLLCERCNFHVLYVLSVFCCHKMTQLQPDQWSKHDSGRPPWVRSGKWHDRRGDVATCAIFTAQVDHDHIFLNPKLWHRARMTCVAMYGSVKTVKSYQLEKHGADNQPQPLGCTYSFWSHTLLLWKGDDSCVEDIVAAQHHCFITSSCLIDVVWRCLRSVQNVQDTHDSSDGKGKGTTQDFEIVQTSLLRASNVLNFAD